MIWDAEKQEDPVAPQDEAFEDEQEPDDGKGTSLEALLWRKSRIRIMEAYRLYREDPARHEGALYQAVIKFAHNKLYPLEFEFKDHGTTDTVDDFAQEVAWKIWEGMKEPRPGKPDWDWTQRTPAGFYAWLNRLCFTKLMDAGKALRKAVDEKAPLFVTVPGDDDGVPEENPALNRFSDTIDCEFNIPEWVVGTDRCICQLMLDGRDYAQIAKELGMSLTAVEKRMSRLRQEVKDRKIDPALCQDSTIGNRLLLQSKTALPTDKGDAMTIRAATCGGR